MVTAGEILLATGLTVAVGGAGAFAGDSYVRASIPSASEVSDAEHDVDAAKRAYENLTDPNSCERGVLVSVSMDPQVIRQSISATAVEQALVGSCGNDQELANQASLGLEEIGSATKHYSFLESRTENPTRDRAIGMLVGGLGLIVVSGGLLIYAVEDGFR